MSDTSAECMFTVRSALGIFKMLENSPGEYEGSANDRTLVLHITGKPPDLRFSAKLEFHRPDESRAPQELSGGFVTYSGLCTYIATWMDDICDEEIEEYSRDVRYFQSSGGKIAYWAFNTHLDTPPVVFVHGGPGGDSNPVKARRLRLDHPVYLFDQMGCGYSDPIRDYDSWTLDEYIGQMDEFIESIPAGKVILVGASWGAGLSVAYADATSYRKVCAMVLPSPFLSSKLWTEDMWQNLRSMGSNHYDIVKHAVENKNFGPEFIKSLGEYNARYLFNRRIFREYALASASEEPNETFRKLNGPNDMVITGKLKEFDVTPALEKIRVPVLFMCADSDEVPVSRIVEYHREVKGSRLSIIPNAGHVLSLEQFDLYRGAIIAFLSELNLREH